MQVEKRKEAPKIDSVSSIEKKSELELIYKLYNKGILLYKQGKAEEGNNCFVEAIELEEKYNKK